MFGEWLAGEPKECLEAFREFDAPAVGNWQRPASDAVPGNEPSVQPASLILEVHAPPNYHPREISRNPNLAMVEQTVRDLSWSDITFVVLKADDNNWIEASGSLNPQDGLSARYMADGKEHVSAQAPKSLDEIITLLQSYCARDGRWQELIEWD